MKNDGSFFADEVSEGSPVYLIVSPEQLKMGITRDLLTSNQMDFVVVDECHVSAE